VKEKITFPKVLFFLFALIIVGLGIRKFLENRETIAKFDRDHNIGPDGIRRLYEGVK